MAAFVPLLVKCSSQLSRAPRSSLCRHRAALRGAPRECSFVDAFSPYQSYTRLNESLQRKRRYIHTVVNNEERIVGVFIRNVQECLTRYNYRRVYSVYLVYRVYFVARPYIYVTR